MKKLTILFIVCLLACINFNGYSQNKKVAVTTFWVSKHIGFDELGGGAGLAAAIGTLSDDPNFNLQPVLDNFYNIFINEYSKNFPFDLMPEDDVLQREEYVNYESRWNETKDADRGKLFQRYLTPKGYKPMIETLFKGKNNNTMRMLEIFDDADGVMFVSMGYDFVKKTVPFTAGVRAFVRIKLWNKEGKKVFAINEYGTSKKSVAIVAGIPIMKTDKLLPLCESASEKLVADLAKRIGKVSKKAAKKL